MHNKVSLGLSYALQCIAGLIALNFSQEAAADLVDDSWLLFALHFAVAVANVGVFFWHFDWRGRLRRA